MSARVGEVQFCSWCGACGFEADTTAGEVVVEGRVVWTVPSGSRVLLVGRVDGSGVGRLFCDVCGSLAESKEGGVR